MSSSRYLIVNADDLGISSEVNRGVFLAHEEGVVTDSSLLIRGPCSKEAFETVKHIPSFQVGLHIDLDALLGWESPGKERLPRQELLRLMNDPGFLRRVREDIDEQIRSFLDEGLTPSHVDTHHHVHGFPQIFWPLLEVMERYGIKTLRFSRNGYHLMGREDILITSQTASWMERTLHQKEIVCPDHFIDPLLPFSLKECSNGVTELMVHPSTGGESWRIKDFDMLMNPLFMTHLRQEGIELISFSDLRDSLSWLT